MRMIQILFFVAITCLLCIPPVIANDITTRPIIIGINADISSQDAQAGEAIRRGAMVAIYELNRKGGILGRPLMLELHDHRRNPARGVVNTQTLAENEDVVAILGGKHTPVIFAELDVIHDYGIPYLIPWAAGTQLVDNGQDPNFVFRVSVRDEYAGAFLVEHALKQGYQRLGLLLEQTSWGRSNELALTVALREQGVIPARTEWFNWGERDFTKALQRIHAAKVEMIIFVGNAPDGVNFMRAMHALPEAKRLPIISHWGIVGGDFEHILQEELQHLDLAFLQTFSFFAPPFPERAEHVFTLYQKLFPETKTIADISSPTGVAHAYDLMHLLARAIELAQTTDRTKVRDALERIDFHAGLVRNYQPPFTPSRHDALDTTDFRMARFANGVVVPFSDVLVD